MIEKPTYGMKRIFVLLVIITLVGGASLRQAPAQNASDESKPIHITSDRFDAYAEKRKAVFSGNVVVIQGDTTINSDEFCLYYKKGMTGGKKTKQFMSPGAEQSGNIEKIEAKGNVTIKQKEKIVTGGQAVFFNDEQKIIVTGNPVMKDGENEIRGDTIIFFMAENKGVVKSSANQRVTATIYPEEKKQ